MRGKGCDRNRETFIKCQPQRAQRRPSGFLL